MNKSFYVYVMGNDRPTLYIGVTSNLAKRIYEHQQGRVNGFTKKYGLKKLLYFEVHQTAESAIMREKQLKNWNREWKIRLIQKRNQALQDISNTL